MAINAIVNYRLVHCSFHIISDPNDFILALNPRRWALQRRLMPQLLKEVETMAEMSDRVRSWANPPQRDLRSPLLPSGKVKASIIFEPTSGMSIWATISRGGSPYPNSRQRNANQIIGPLSTKTTMHGVKEINSVFIQGKTLPHPQGK